MKELISDGYAEEEAANLTDAALVIQIKNELKDISKTLEYREKLIARYYDSLVSGTSRGRALVEKRGAGIPFDKNRFNFSFGYLKRDLKSLVQSNVDIHNSPIGILFKVEERLPRGIGGFDEYYVLSHVPVEDVSGALVALPKKEYVGRSVPEGVDWIDWFYIEISERGASGEAKIIRFFKTTEAEFRANQKAEELIGTISGNKSDCLANAAPLLAGYSELRKFVEAFCSGQ